MFKRILVANRGEIAVRILRACREMGIQGVAVASEADRDALHVRMADASVILGPAPSRESYLVQEKVVQAALDTGAEAIHPGYGFLSENAAFARQVAKAGLKFIGPSPEAMDQMGDKVNARANAKAAGVPIAEGSAVLKDPAHAKAEADRIGYPVMMKASAGGGGIGMRVVRKDAEMEDHFRSATAQAHSAFGNPDLFLEKFIERPRHIEVQVLGDEHGHIVHLGERECSIQRRHQKLVEEAPSPALTPAQRDDIGAKAVALAKRVGYSNAGTMEFLYQGEPPSTRRSGDSAEPSGSAGAGRFFFNEMNTRLQVEHPVTELVTGIDLVQWQLRIAGGERLTIQQADVQLRGHAFEARINAEDPANGFAPSPGPVRRLQTPSGPGIRFDSGLREGWTVPSHYDSMVAKLLVHAPDRASACRRMLRALDELRIDGFATNQAFHQALFAEPDFVKGDLSTRYLEEHDLQGAIADALRDAQADGRMRVAALTAALDGAPGGGLAGAHLRSSLPKPVGPKRLRDWEAA
ncbi:MAG TPA: acetyl-CoA carboxylase biotin carboxylase subunit [Candidatus Thermoplasmatota archaeon]|nr:acetyl-CoA carboxylase biotin carboxylase subunit [Candidatus Thermoplasmatota archaeon]